MTESKFFDIIFSSKENDRIKKIELMNNILVIVLSFLIGTLGTILSVLVFGRIDDELPTLTTVPVFFVLFIGSLYAFHTLF